MNLSNKTLNEFIEMVDSASPAPGGGSVAALMSVLGLALARMVGHLSVNKKKFLKLDDCIKKEFNEALANLAALKEKIMPLIDEDTASFQAIMQAFSLPKETNDELAIRNKAIKIATLKAIQVPYQVAKLSISSFAYFSNLLQYGNQQAISDLGVSLLALSSGIEGALYNVLINIINFDDELIVSYYQNEVKSLLQENNKFRELFSRQILNRLTNN